ncbi:MAG: hypothetical protein AAF394_14985, partial [Planctomycetota bacterium]
MAVSAAPSEINSATTDNGQLLAADGVPLSTKLARATRRSRIQAFLLVLPLLAFVTIFFVTPIVKMALLSFSDDVFVTEMPRTTKALASWNGQGIPDESAPEGWRARWSDVARQESRQALNPSAAAAGRRWLIGR